VREIRGRGLLLGIRTDRPEADLVTALLKRGVLIGGSLATDVARLLPPLTIGEAEVEEFLAAWKEVV
jgi:acetylornithine/succinyldiaminopimelate/putrescine aminotransferase